MAERNAAEDLELWDAMSHADAARFFTPGTWEALPYWVKAAQAAEAKVVELEAQVAALRWAADAANRYLAVKKSWDNRLKELVALKEALAALEVKVDG